MKHHLVIAFMLIGVGFAGHALAATADMSKLTCKEVASMAPARIVGVAMWVNGYVHGKAGNPMIDGEKAHANAEKIAAYCKSNSSATVAAALEAVTKS
ncbi:hypothetical protein Rleg10DRAFT_3668 [Rhizobium leguminosarum bv. trifolii WSM2012]|nr:hypothetical protein Rleg10DRAFT_3668 [Rhizobium leguminosarum bv. trifolii WSM2012]